MEYTDPVRGEEFLDRALEVLSDDIPTHKKPRRFSSEEIHAMLACWSFAMRPLDPSGGTVYIRYVEDCPDILPIVIEPADPVGDHLLAQAVHAIQELRKRVDRSKSQEES